MTLIINGNDDFMDEERTITSETKLEQAFRFVSRYVKRAGAGVRVLLYGTSNQAWTLECDPRGTADTLRRICVCVG